MKTATTKTCTKCGEEKELTEYYFRSNRKYHYAQCKLCMNKQQRADYKKNREARLVTLREYRIANKDKIKAYREEQQCTNQPYIRKKARENRLKNLEAYRERDRRYWHTVTKHKDEYMASRNAYDRMRASAETDNHTVEEMHAYWRANGIDPKRCTYCDAWHTKWDNSWKTSAGDHVIPVSRGGKDILENLVPCCKSCNSSKNHRLVGEEWVPPKDR